jgi:hypothetical protein
VIRPLAALAVVTFALGAAATPPPRGARTAVKNLAAVRAEIVSGDRQKVRAYATLSRPTYAAGFPTTLIVRVSGPKPKEGDDRIVVFSCVTPGCTFVSTDQPDEGKYIERVGTLYKVTVVKGRAALNVTLEGDSPASDYIVKALPSVHDGERAVAASFTLTMY